MSGFYVGMKQSEFYDCRGQSLVAKKKQRQQSISTVSPSPVPEISPLQPADTVDYDQIFGDILSKIGDNEEGYWVDYKSASGASSLNLKVYDDEEQEETEEFPKYILYQPNEWNHMAYVYSGDRLREYINGVLTEDLKCDFRLLGGGLNKLQVGASNDDYRFTGFKGCLDEMIIHNYALRKKEVMKLYKYKDQ